MKVSGAFLKNYLGSDVDASNRYTKLFVKNDLIAAHMFPPPMLYIGITQMLGNVKNVAEQLYVAS